MLKSAVSQMAAYVTDVDIENFFSEINIWQKEILAKPHSEINDAILATLDSVVDIFLDNCDYERM